jgi:hypothetical protein
LIDTVFKSVIVSGAVRLDFIRVFFAAAGSAANLCGDHSQQAKNKYGATFRSR